MKTMAKMAYPKSVVIFAAHPDDTEIFCAGTLALLREKGYAVTVCTVTSGGMGGIGSDEKSTIAIREKEARAAAEILGSRYVCLGGRDGFLFDSEEMRIKAQDVIREAEAGIVIAHLGVDYHPDHRAASAIAEAAAILASLPNIPSRFPPLAANPLLYHSATLGLTDPLGNPIARPHFFVDIGSVEELKMRMLACHQSQIEIMKVQHKMDDFFGAMQAQDLSWGREAGVRFAEAYWQHLGGGFQKTPLIQDELGEFVIRG
jgi:LmbE family N-acetylglucosaminyl deacetylase